MTEWHFWWVNRQLVAAETPPATSSRKLNEAWVLLRAARALRLEIGGRAFEALREEDRRRRWGQPRRPGDAS